MQIIGTIGLSDIGFGPQTIGLPDDIRLLKNRFPSSAHVYIENIFLFKRNLNFALLLSN